MKKTINYYEFKEEFRVCGRENQFTLEGLQALFDYIEDYEEQEFEEYELDVIELCCEFTEYSSLEEYNKDYNEECEDIEDVEYNTMVIRIDDKSFIIQNY